MTALLNSSSVINQEKIRFLNLAANESERFFVDFREYKFQIREMKKDVAIDTFAISEHQKCIELIKNQFSNFQTKENRGYLKLLVHPYEDEIIMHSENMKEILDDLKELSKEYKRDLLEYTGLQESMEYLLWREPDLITHVMNLDFLPEKSFYMDDSKSYCLRRLFMERGKKRIIHSVLEASGFSPFSLFFLKHYMFFFIILGIFCFIYFFYKKNKRFLNKWTCPKVLS